MKNILIVIPSLSKAGAERVAARLGKMFTKDFKVIYVLFSNEVKYEYSGDVLVLKTPKYFSKLLKPFSYIFQLKQIKKKYEIDVSISFLDLPNMINILSNYKKTKTIVSIRNYISYEYENYKNGKIIVFIIKKIYNFSDKVVVVSNDIRNDLIENYGLIQNKVHTIYNPIETYTSGLHTDDVIKSIKDWKLDSTLICNMGRLEFQKNQKDFIEIISKLRVNGLNVKGLIIGEGTYRGKLESQIEQLGLKESIKLIGHINNPFPLLEICDVYLMTSYYEGFPNALLEAMMTESYIISTNCKSGPSEILNTQVVNVPSTYGLLIDDLYRSSITSEMVNSIHSVILDKEIREQSVSNAKQRLADFSNQKIGSEWISLINSLDKR